MSPDEYVKLAVRLENKDYESISNRLGKQEGPDVIPRLRLLHAAIGLCTEAGEFQDALKREIFYGKNADRVNLKEEIGDILWYCALACDALGIGLEEVLAGNIAKLTARYPDKFKESDALSRDLDKERVALGGSEQ